MLVHNYTGLLPRVSPVNHTDKIIENTHVIIYFKVDTDKNLTSNPNLTFNGSTEMSRWRVRFYAMTIRGIGDEIQDVSNVHHFYVCLETKTKFLYKYDNGRYAIQVENGCGSSELYIDLKGLYKLYMQNSIGVAIWLPVILITIYSMITIDENSVFLI